jgi:uncharacterized membrane protein
METQTVKRNATGKVNIHRVERVASAVLGAGLLVRGISRHPLSAAAQLALGGWLIYRGISGHSYLYQTLGINTAGVGKPGEAEKAREAGVSADAAEVRRSITVEKPAHEVYRFWREPQKLSQIMGGFIEVTPVSEGRAHWRVRGPFGRSMEWDTRVVEDRPGEVLRWESLEGAPLPNEGSVYFRPALADQETEATLFLRFNPPGGTLGNTVVKRLRIVPRIFADMALRRFKSLAETGEVPTH